MCCGLYPNPRLNKCLAHPDDPHAVAYGRRRKLPTAAGVCQSLALLVAQLCTVSGAAIPETHISTAKGQVVRILVDKMPPRFVRRRIRRSAWMPTAMSREEFAE